MRTDDGYIIDKCLNGEPEAFGLLVEKYKVGIYAFVLAKLHNYHDAQEVAQDVFVKAYTNLKKLKRWDSFAGWLYRIAINSCKNKLKILSRRPDREFAEDQTQETIDEPSIDSYRDDMLCESVREALDSLPETYQQVLTMYYVSGMDSTEIAKILCISSSAVRHRLIKAREQLKEEVLTMMGISFEQHRLPASFTIRIVETVKHIKINTFPTVKELPWGVSLLTGIIATILILNPIPISINLMDTPFYSPLPTDTQVLKIGEIPVDVVKASNLPFISSTMGKGNGDEPNPQNTFFMAPKGEGGEWKQKGDMPIPRTGTCSAVINGKIYVIGGSIIAAGVPVSIVEEYDPIKDTWTRKADMPTPRFLATAAVVEDKIYVIGGGQSLVTFLNTLEEYNPAIDKWTAKADMPTQRGCLDAEAVNGKIYAIGGYTANNAFGMGIVEEYDPKMDTWTQKADLNVPRYAISTSIVDGKIYAIGGSQGPSLSTVELYDPAADKWEIKKPMPTTREYLSTAVVDNKIYAFGGMNGNIAFDGIINVEMYDPKTDTWTIEPNMPEPNVAFSCESVDQRIYIIGGESFFTFFGNNPLLPSVREYNPLGLKENPVYPKGKLPSTWGERKLIK